MRLSGEHCIYFLFNLLLNILVELRVNLDPYPYLHMALNPTLIYALYYQHLTLSVEFDGQYKHKLLMSVKCNSPDLINSNTVISRSFSTLYTCYLFIGLVIIINDMYRKRMYLLLTCNLRYYIYYISN